jgi:hypothetical protein
VKEVSVANFEVFSQHFSVDTEGNYGGGGNSVRKHDIKVDL